MRCFLFPPPPEEITSTSGLPPFLSHEEETNLVFFQFPQHGDRPSLFFLILFLFFPPPLRGEKSHINSGAVGPLPPSPWIHIGIYHSPFFLLFLPKRFFLSNVTPLLFGKMTRWYFFSSFLSFFLRMEVSCLLVLTGVSTCNGPTPSIFPP